MMIMLLTFHCIYWTATVCGMYALSTLTSNSNLRVGWYLPVNVNAFFNLNSTHTPKTPTLWTMMLFSSRLRHVCVKIKWFGTRSFLCCCNSENNRSDALLGISVTEQKKRENVKKNAIALGSIQDAVRCMPAIPHWRIEKFFIKLSLFFHLDEWVRVWIRRKRLENRTLAHTQTRFQKKRELKSAEIFHWYFGICFDTSFGRSLVYIDVSSIHTFWHRVSMGLLCEPTISAFFELGICDLSSYLGWLCMCALE